MAREGRVCVLGVGHQNLASFRCARDFSSACTGPDRASVVPEQQPSFFPPHLLRGPGWTHQQAPGWSHPRAPGWTHPRGPGWSKHLSGRVRGKWEGAGKMREKQRKCAVVCQGVSELVHQPSKERKIGTNEQADKIGNFSYTSPVRREATQEVDPDFRTRGFCHLSFVICHLSSPNIRNIENTASTAYTSMLLAIGKTAEKPGLDVYG